MHTIRVSIDKSAATMIFWRITGAKVYPYRAIAESILAVSQGWIVREFPSENWREFQRKESNIES